MLRALDPDEVPPPPDYRVPWHVDRTDDSHPRVTNASDSPADFVRAFIDDQRRARRTDLWGQLLPGESVELCLCDLDPAETTVTIAWFRSLTGAEYVWRFVL